MPNELRLACAAIILGMLAFIGYTVANPATRHLAGGDFSGFYGPGAILAEGARDRVYDVELQRERYHALTGRTGRQLVYLHAPFFTLLFQPLSHLPFPAAYLVWLMVTAALFAAGILLVAPPGLREPALWLGFAFPVFLHDTFMAGQVSATSFLALAAAIALERRGRHFASGAAIAFCVHKPSLLIWIVPMLMVTRRGRAMCGLAVSSAALAAVSVAAGGWTASVQFVSIMLGWLRDLTTPKPADYVVRLWKNYDLNSFGKLGFDSAAGTVAAAAAAVIVIALMWRAWRSGSRELAWCATLAGNMLVNPYTPCYECLPLVLALILVAEYDRAAAFRWYLAFSAAGWFSQELARNGWPQLFTAVLFGFAVHLAAIGRRHAAEEPECVPAAMTAGR